MSPSIDELIQTNALFVVNHSGGKDSQAMMIELLKRIPRAQLLVVHASLGEVEWPGALEHAEKQASDARIPFIVAHATKTFFEMVERRFDKDPSKPCWPSASIRQCTSDLKRGPIEREVRRYAKAHDFSRIVNCIGIRAAESVNRAKQSPFRTNERNSVAGRQWFDWLPIFDVPTDKAVFGIIAGAGQQPHAAYIAGNRRLSCMFCIMACKSDLQNAARHNPSLFNRYVELERRTGYTMHQSRKALAELVAA